MKLPKEKILEEMWATHQLLLNLGFRADDIYVYDRCLGPDGVERLGIVLRTQGLQWVCFFDAPDGVSDLMSFLEDDWGKYVDRMKSLPMEEKTIAYEESDTRKETVSIVASLLAKGFALPYKIQKLN